MSTTTATLEQRIRQELGQLTDTQVGELARVIDLLVEALHPERIHVFGSQARGDANADSDIDLMVIVRDSDDPSYRRAQQAYMAIGRHRVPVEILVWTCEEFNRGLPNPATLQATIIREGKVLYAVSPTVSR